MPFGALLSNAAIYNFTQWIVGAERPRRYSIAAHAQAFAGARVLDIGCGPGLALRYLPAVEYVGYEPNPRYVASARRRFGHLATFVCGYFDERAAAKAAPYDLVLLLGVLHHCDDATAEKLLADIRVGLAPQGRVVTLDPCYTPSQSRLARHVARLDRGKYVRTPEGYRELGGRHLRVLDSETRDGLLLIPTTVHIGAFGS